MIELLSPVGDFECLKAAVQNRADAVYFGANLFSARAFATNFDNDNLKQVINYAKLRGVKTHLTLNTLIKQEEFRDAFKLAKTAYEYGIDAIIVQDLGLADILIKKFPDLEVHGSTQMTIHNLEGVKKLEKLGFKRAVLARELSINEIEHICKNSNIEIEVFAHGALCISYSGQCLMSSLIGGRSGNRGKCAQPCRLPYELLDENEKTIDKGYLLSTRDLCGLETLPQLIKSGVSSLKIEGRMKTPEYVATVTRIYRKYIDLAEKYILGEITEYIINEKDKQDLMQVFNRGGFSNGHLSNDANQKLVYPQKQNNMGLPLGKIIKYNSKKGLVTAKLENTLSIGDGISFENENTKYTISELMEKDKNIKQSENNKTVTFGRMKGNINLGDKIYKISDKELSTLALESYSKEYRKNLIACKLNIRKNQKISVTLYSKDFDVEIDFVYDYIPELAQNAPITEEKIINQFNKTLDTCFQFDNFEIYLDNNLFIPVSVINDIRREALSKLETKILSTFIRNTDASLPVVDNLSNIRKMATPSVSLLLNILNINLDYSKLEDIDKIYIPLKYFKNKTYRDIILKLSSKFKLYIYLPTIIKKDYMSVAKNIIDNAISTFKIYGIVVSNLSQLEILPNAKLDIIGNYTLNLYNSFTSDKLSNVGLHTITVSPELDKDGINNICNTSTINKELIVYGNTPLMTMNYCLFGKSNKCYEKCNHSCTKEGTYYLKDRMGFKFRVLPDNTQTISTIYNSKTTSISYTDFNVQNVRIDILDETINEINDIVKTVISGNRMEGKDFTNGNINRVI